MTIVVPQGGEQKFLENMMNKTAPQDLSLKLHSNNITPSETDVAGSYTESTEGGYAAITLTGASWGAASGGDPATIAYGQQTFTFNGTPGTDSVFGYNVVGGSDGIIRWAESFAEFQVRNNGDNIKVTPTVTGD